MKYLQMVPVYPFFAVFLITTGCAGSNPQKPASSMSSPTGASTSPISASSVAKGPKILGIGTHTINTVSDQRKTVIAVAQAGANAVREDAPWKFVETTKGSYSIPSAWDSYVDALNRKGIKIVLILDYGNQFYDGGDKPRSAEAIAAYVRYATFVAHHFAGRVHYYEIWNEWDNKIGGTNPGTPEEYAKVFDATFPALKAVDPSVTVLLGSGIHVGPYYDALAKSGQIAKADGISIHPYNWDTALGPEVCASFLTEVEKRLVSLTGRPIIDIYVTEVGWPTSTSHGGFSENRQAQYAYRTMSLLPALPFIKGVWWFDLRDAKQGPSTDREDKFGIIHNDWSPKPAMAAYNKAAAFAIPRQLSLSGESDLATARVKIDAINPDGSKSNIAWNLHDTKPPFYASCTTNTGTHLMSDAKAGAMEIIGTTLIDGSNRGCKIEIIQAGEGSESRE